MHRLFDLILLTIWICACTHTTDTYTIASFALPHKLDPWHEQSNATGKIYPSLYYPLIQATEDNHLSSHYLDLSQSKSLSPNFELYRLCLRSDAVFSDGSSIELNDLEVSLRKIHKHSWALSSLNKLEREKQCLRVKLTRGDSEYLHRLQYSWAVVLKASTVDSPAPIGLGPYRVTRFEKNQIALEAVPNQVPGDLKHLVFAKVDLSAPNTYETLRIDDWNYHSWADKPNTKGFHKIVRKIWRSKYQNIFFPDKKLRHEYARCLDRDLFAKVANIQVERRDILYPEGMLPGVETFLPKRSPASKCYFPGQRPRITYYHFIGPIEPIREFYDKAGRSLPFEVIVKQVSNDEAMEAWHKSAPSIFTCTLSGNDARPESFFSEFLSDSQPAAVKVAGLRELLFEASFETDPAKKRELLVAAHQKVVDHGVVIPFGQSIATMYFRPELRNIILGNSGQSFPQFHLIRVSPHWQTALTTMLGWIGF